MNNWIRTLLTLTVALVLIGNAASLQEPAKKPVKDSKEATAKPATFKVEKGPFKLEVALKGNFEALGMTEVSLGNLEAWTPQSGGQLIVKKAVEHGTPIRKGDPVVWLDLERIERTIADLENDLQQSAQAIKLTAEELPVLEKAMPLELAALARAKSMADEDLKKFLEQDKAWTEKSVHFQVKRYHQYLEYAKEELKQLQKMYRAKDLTEETEEIILRRQRNTVEMMEFFVQMAERERDQFLKLDLPRREQLMIDNARKLDFDLQKAQATAPLVLNQKRLALARQRYDFDKSTARLAKLKRDLEGMTVRAPADGIVYHGKCVRGQWSAGGFGGDRLTPGSMLQGPEVLLTIVKARPLFVRAVVDEKELRHLKPGLTGKAAPVAFPDLKLAAKLERISAVPIAPEKFEARIAVVLTSEADAVMPGMAGTVKFISYQNANALTLPASAVFTDDLDEDKNYVLVPGKDGKPEKRAVTVGKRAERKVEIVQGLKEGEEVLQEKPSEAKKGDGPVELKK